ncbi:hypothetical protein ACFB49_39700 [Sphingomonas sp. DBB INV C78]|uniref:hypothetical protein n=1 Tax=Sphingomonas sp. DBB INV C78 TaxID=3349434 RepID=UPI0036D20984
MTGGQQWAEWTARLDHDRWAESTGDQAAFEGGPPRRLSALAFLPAPICPNGGSRVILVFMLGWVPLALLVAFAPDGPRALVTNSFARDFGVHARLGVAVPLLVLAFSVCAKRLGVVALHFLRSGLLEEADKVRFLTQLAATRRLINSLWVEAATIFFTYALVISTLLNEGALFVQSAWQRSADGAGLSPAGWWNALVGTPLLIVLLIGWMWRIFLWTRFLRIVARMDLQLIAAHPDQSAGLGFLTQSVRAFSVVGMAFGAISAGRFAMVHAAGATNQFTDGLLIGGTALFVTLLFVGPLTPFSIPLMKSWRNGAMAYGALASELGQQFERRWFAQSRTSDPGILGEPDFSAATDLYQVVGNVYAMRFIPVDLRSIMILLGMTLVPFIPAMFLSMPTEVVIAELKGLLF